MKPFKTLLPLAVACAFLAGAHAASNNDGEGGSPTVIEHGAKAAANGVERGAKAAGHGIERGLEATGRALNKASEKRGSGKPADNTKAGGNPLPQVNERSG